MGRSKRRRHRKKSPAPAATGAGEAAKSAPKKQSSNNSAGSGRRSPIFWAVVAAGVFAAGAGIFFLRPGPGRTPVNKHGPLNVLLITLDTTRADRVGCYGYAGGRTPNIDALARGGVLFKNAYAQVPLTLPSHCSIMTGTYPFSHGVHNNGSYLLRPEHTTLAEMLKVRGFRTAAFVASFSVDSRFGLDQGFDLYDDNFQAEIPFKPVNSERRADTVEGLFSSWVEGHSSELFFSWIHFFDPHLPYRPPAPYDGEFAGNPYDGEIAFMDAAVGRVIDKLKEKNLLERTLIILAGDHGEAFGEKVETGHGVFLYEGTLKVPMIFYARGILPEGKTISSRVRLIDIVPTVLETAGFPIPAEIQGQSLLPLIERKKGRDLDSYIETFYPRENYGWSELTGLISGDWKFIRAPKPELYNLKADPAEIRNEASASAGKASDMSRNLEALVRKSAGISENRSKALTAEEQERLRSLGYINFAGGETKSFYPDPKDNLEVLKLAQLAEGYELEGRYAEAKEAYTKLVGLVPESPSSYVNLALSQAHLQQFDEAIATLRLGLEKIPDSEVLQVRLGHTYLVTGRAEAALDSMERVVAQNPRNVDACTAAAAALDSLGRKAEARAYLEKGLAVEPENKFLRASLAANLASTGNIGQAIEAYKGLVADYPGDPVLHLQLGVAYAVSGKFADAAESLKKSISIKPTPTAYINLAVASERVGDTAAAVESLRLYLADTTGENPASVRAAEAELRRLENLPRK